MFQATLSHGVFKSGIHKTRKGECMSSMWCTTYKNCQYADYTGAFNSVDFGDLTDDGICGGWYQRKYALEAEIRPKLVFG
jgi:hypothetical protein